MSRHVGRTRSGDVSTAAAPYAGLTALRDPAGERAPVRTLDPGDFEVLHARRKDTDGLLYRVLEHDQGADLNGDGDTRDVVDHVYDLSTGETTNLRFEGVYQGNSGDRFLWLVGESDQEVDLTGDGDVLDRVPHIHDLSTAATANLGLSVRRAGVWANSVYLQVLENDENGEGLDLNGDGDTDDSVLHVHDLSTRETTNHRLALPRRSEAVIGAGNHHLVLRIDESDQRMDLNGDGDTDDTVFHVHDLLAGDTRNLRLSGHEMGNARDRIILTSGDRTYVHDLSTGDTVDQGLGGGWRRGNWFLADGDWLAWEATGVVHLHDFSTAETTRVSLSGALTFLSGSWFGFHVHESEQEGDLNGDGDTVDTFLHVRDLSTGRTTDLAFTENAAAPVGDRLLHTVYERQQGEDLNSDGDTDDSVYQLVDLQALEGSPNFIRGDCNDDGKLDISDAVLTLGSLFLGDQRTRCDDACDSNDDGAIDITDAIGTLGFLFLGQPPPAAPGTWCGLDRTPDSLGCRTFETCDTNG